eukprot:1096333-Pelagomonas_calceolata.AAC.2
MRLPEIWGSGDFSLPTFFSFPRFEAESNIHPCPGGGVSRVQALVAVGSCPFLDKTREVFAACVAFSFGAAINAFPVFRAKHAAASRSSLQGQWGLLT